MIIYIFLAYGTTPTKHSYNKTPNKYQSTIFKNIYKYYRLFILTLFSMSLVIDHFRSHLIKVK